MSSRTSEPDILIFGARRHDPAYWQAHPEVTEAEAHFDGQNGWVRLDVRPDARCTGGTCKSVVTTSEATRDDPDLYFWGEGDCPVDLFEKAPRAREVRVWIEGPVEDDPRTCWSVGLWLSDPIH